MDRKPVFGPVGHTASQEDIRRAKYYIRRLPWRCPVRSIALRWMQGMVPVAAEIAVCRATLQNPSTRSSMDAALAAWILAFTWNAPELRADVVDYAWKQLARATQDDETIGKENRIACWSAIGAASSGLFYLATLRGDTPGAWLGALQAVRLVAAIGAIGTAISAIVSLGRMAIRPIHLRVSRVHRGELLMVLATYVPSHQFPDLMRNCVRRLSTFTTSDCRYTYCALCRVLARAANEGHSETLNRDVEKYLNKNAGTFNRAHVLWICGIAGTEISLAFVKAYTAKPKLHSLQPLAESALVHLQTRITQAKSTQALLRPANSPGSDATLLLRTPAVPGDDHLLATPAQEPGEPAENYLHTSH